MTDLSGGIPAFGKSAQSLELNPGRNPTAGSEPPSHLHRVRGEQWSPGSFHSAPASTPASPPPTTVITGEAAERPTGAAAPGSGGCPGHLQLVLLPVDDYSCDLLVHEYEDRAQEGRDHRGDHSPPGVGPDGVNEPPPVIPCWLGEKQHGLCVLTPETRAKRNQIGRVSFFSFCPHLNEKSLEKQMKT